MKRILSILLALVILLQPFSKVWIVCSFKANQDYIAKVMCINRDKPELHCNGKCVLMQRIQAEERKQEKDRSQKGLEQKEMLYCSMHADGPLERPAVWGRQPKKTFYYPRPFTTSFVRGIFHPPDFQA